MGKTRGTTGRTRSGTTPLADPPEEVPEWDPYEEVLDADEDLGETDEEGRWWPRRDWTSFGPSHPIEVDGGVVARSKRGDIGESWWSRRFLSAIESLAEGDRLSRGKSYARKGQVIDLRFEPGVIEASVQGTRRVPYEVQIAIPVLTDADWGAVLGLLAAEAVYAAELLAGEMPHQIEEVFAQANVNLFPSRAQDLSTVCSCPDWANRCKHVAAVCYLAAEALDVDPFLLLALRGREREPLLDELRRLRGAKQPGAAQATETSEEWPSLTEVLADFWQAGSGLADVRVQPRASIEPAAVLAQVRPGIIELRGEELAEVLAEQYEEIARAAEQRAF